MNNATALCIAFLIMLVLLLTALLIMCYKSCKKSMDELSNYEECNKKFEKCKEELHNYKKFYENVIASSELLKKKII